MNPRYHLRIFIWRCLSVRKMGKRLKESHCSQEQELGWLKYTKVKFLKSHESTCNMALNRLDLLHKYGVRMVCLFVYQYKNSWIVGKVQPWIAKLPVAVSFSWRRSIRATQYFQVDSPAWFCCNNERNNISDSSPSLYANTEIVSDLSTVLYYAEAEKYAMLHYGDIHHV